MTKGRSLAVTKASSLVFSLITFLCIQTKFLNADTQTLADQNDAAITALQAQLTAQGGSAAQFSTQIPVRIGPVNLGGFRSHGATINAAEWNPQYNILATGGAVSGVDNTTLRLYRLTTSSDTLTELIALAQATAAITSLAWSADGTQLAIGTSSATVFIYKFVGTTGSETLTQLFTGTPTGLTGSINGLSWRSDNRVLGISGSTSNIVGAYRFENLGSSSTLVQLTTFNPNTTPMSQVAWQPTAGGYLATVQTSSFIVNVCSFTYSGGNWTLSNLGGAYTHSGTIDDLIWSQDGSFLAVVGAGYITFLKATSAGFTKVVDLRATFKIKSCAWSSDNTKFVIVGDQGSHAFYDITQTSPIALDQRDFGSESGGTFTKARWLSTNYAVFAGDSAAGYQLRIRKISTQASATRISLGSPINADFGDIVNSVAWRPGGRYVAMGGVRNSNIASTSTSLRIFSFTQSTGTFSEVTSARTDYGSNVVSLAWHPNGQFLIAGGTNTNSGGSFTYNIYQFDDANLILAKVAQLNIGTTSNVGNAVAWTPDGNFFATGTLEAPGIAIYSFNQSTYTATSVTTASTSSVPVAINWNASGSFFAVAMGTGGSIIYPWDGVSVIGTPGTALVNSTTNDVKFSPNGKFLATAISGTTTSVQILSVSGTTLASVATFASPTTNVFSVDWNHDGRYLISGGASTSSVSLRVYTFDGVSTLTEDTTQRRDHTAQVNSVAVHPDQEHFVMGGNRVSSTISSRIFEATLTPAITATQIDINPNGANSAVNTVRWSPDGNYLAVGTNSGLVVVYSYTAATNTYTQLTTFSHGAAVYKVAWHPTGNYLAMAGGYVAAATAEHRVFSFNGSTLTELTGCRVAIDTLFAYALGWSPNGNYLALAGGNESDTSTYVYSFNGTTLTQAASLNGTGSQTQSDINWRDNNVFAMAGQNGSVLRFFYFTAPSTLAFITTGSNQTASGYGNNMGVDWHPSGNWVVVTATGGAALFAYNSGTQTITVVSSTAIALASGTNVQDIRWNPAGTVVALALPAGTGSFRHLQYWSFNSTTQTFTELVSQGVSLGASQAGNSVSWRDSTHVAFGSSIVSNNGLHTFVLPPAVVSYPIGVDHGGTVEVVDWHPTLDFVAVGGARVSSITHRIYQLNATLGTFTEVATGDHGDTVRGLQWSPDGTKLAVAGKRNSNIAATATTHRVFAFNTTTNTLTEETGARFDRGVGGAADTYGPRVSWSPSGTYLATTGETTGGVQVKILSYAAGVATLVTTGPDFGDFTENSAWSPDGNYLLIVGHRSTTPTKTYRLYQFNSTNNSLTLVDTGDGGGVGNGEGARFASWHPTGNYVAIGRTRDATSGTNATTNVYTFNSTAKTLTEITTARVDHGANISSVKWNLDGTQLLVGGARSSTITDRIYTFNSTAGTLTQLITADHGADVSSIAWRRSNDSYYATGGTSSSSITTRVRQFRSTITGNTLTDLTTTSTLITSTPAAVKWNPNGTQAAVISGNYLNIYSFDATNSLAPFTQIATYNHGAALKGLDWSSDGQFIAIGGVVGTGTFTIRLFTISGATLTLATSVNSSATVNNLEFDPSNTYLTIHQNNGANTVNLYAITFNGTNWSLTQRNNQSSGNFAGAWRPQGDFLLTIDNSTIYYGYSFNRATDTLTSVGGLGGNPQLTAYSVAWHPSGNFVAISGFQNGSRTVSFYSFNVGTPALTAMTGTASINTGNINSFIKWSPDGKYLIMGGTTRSDGREFTALAFNDATQTVTQDFGFARRSGLAYAIDFNPNGLYIMSAIKRGSKVVLEAIPTIGGNGPTTTIDRKLMLRGSDPLQLTATQAIICSGREIRFSCDNTQQLFLDPHITVTFQNALFRNFKTSRVSAGADCRLTFGDGSRVELGESENLLTSLYFQGNVIFDGRGYALNFTTTDRLTVMENSTLTLKNIKLSGVNSQSLTAIASSSRIIFDSVDIEMTADTTYSNGSIEVLNYLHLDGPFTFRYTSNVQSIIDSNSVFRVGRGATFEYNPSNLSTTLLGFADQTARLYLWGGTLSSPNCNMSLTAGRLDSRKLSYLSSGATFKFIFGDGTLVANNLLVHIYDGTLQCSQGEIFYNNLDS